MGVREASLRSAGGASGRGILRQHASLLTWVQQSLDILIALACLYVAAIGRDGAVRDEYHTLALVAGLAMLLIYQWLRTYDRLRMGGFMLEAQVLFKAWGAVLLALATLGFVTKTSAVFSREALLKWAAFGYVAQLAFHVALRAGLQYFRARGHNTRSALLVGAGEPLRRFARLLRENEWLGIRVLGYAGAADAALTDHLGAAERAAEIAAAQQVDLVYIAFPSDQTSQVEGVARSLMALNVDVAWVPDLSAFQLVNHGVREISGQPVIALSDSPLGDIRWVGKWLEDKLLAALILVCIAPLLLAIAIGVKLSSPGPVLFKQRRGGLGGRQIVVWKFRTMRPHRAEAGRIEQATRNDDRITPFGAFLRRTSLDELPQFFNVLQGRMSIVGPRPHAVEHDDYYGRQIDSYMLRHKIKPGITGWAQVNGYRGETEEIEKMEMRVKYDLYYINNWSVWFDLKIVVKTVWSVMFGQNAY